MTENQVNKELSEEEIKDPYGGAMGCFWMFLAALLLALFMLPSIFQWFFT